MSPIEKVARAILKVQFYDGEEGFYDGLDGFYRDIDPDHYFTAMSMARAALLAIREPDEGMLASVIKEFADATVQDPKAAAWDWLRAHKAAIDHALTQENGE